MRESKIQKWFIGELEFRGVECIKLHSRGWPDYACFAGGGKSCFIEFKRTGQKITDPHQFMQRRKLERKGHAVFEVNRISYAMLAAILVTLGFKYSE